MKQNEQNEGWQDSIDEEILVNPQTIARLNQLRKMIKFGVENTSEKFPIGYVGLLPETNQPRAKELLNISIERIINLLLQSLEPTKIEILEEFKLGLESLREVAVDTEDRERVCEYYSEIREIIGFETTNGVLNEWLYGF